MFETSYFTRFAAAEKKARKSRREHTDDADAHKHQRRGDEASFQKQRGPL